MKKIWIQIFIVIIGIILCVIGHNGVKKYFYNNYFDNKNYTLAYNNYSNVSFASNEIEEIPITEELNIPEIDETTTTTTTKITTKKITTTTMITTTTVKPTEVFENIVTKPKEEVDNNEIVYDGLTLSQLTEKLNKKHTIITIGLDNELFNETKDNIIKIKINESVKYENKYTVNMMKNKEKNRKKKKNREKII